MRLWGKNNKTINLTKYRSIGDRLAVSERYKYKLQKDLERTIERKKNLELLIFYSEKDISHWEFWDRQKKELRAVMEKIPILKKYK